MINKKNAKILFLSIACMTAVLSTSCSKIELPDDYDYEDLSEFIELGDYKGIVYEKGNSEVTQAEIKEYIDLQLSSASTKKHLKKGTVESDSIVIIDYKGTMNGKELEGASGEDVEVDMSANDFIDGFAEALLGKSVGDRFSVQLTFPDSYPEELAGKNVDFEMKIDSLEVTQTPEYDEDFIKEHTDYNNKEDYEKAIRKELKEDKKASSDENIKLEVFNTILDTSKVKKYPEEELKARYSAYYKAFQKQAEDNDMDFEKFIGSQYGISLDEFKEEAMRVAKEQVKQELILRQIARKEEIEISKKDYSKYLDGVIDDAGYTRSSFKKETGTSIEEYAEANNLYNTLLYDTVMKKVIKYSIAK